LVDQINAAIDLDDHWRTAGATDHHGDLNTVVAANAVGETNGKRLEPRRGFGSDSDGRVLLGHTELLGIGAEQVAEEASEADAHHAKVNIYIAIEFGHVAIER